MAVQRWLSFGASEIGPAHMASGKPNQDSWACFHHFGCDVLVVGDGVGSRDYSQLGSAAVCRAVDQVVSNRVFLGSPISLSDMDIRAAFLNDIRDAWIDAIQPLSGSEATTTCLFALRDGSGTIWVSVLGDGCAAAIMGDGTVRLLQENKEDSFSNMTQSLMESTESSDWKMMDVDEEGCRAVLLFTDGIADDLVDIEGFAGGLVDSLCCLPAVLAASEAMSMLIDWPTPKHSDDKTLACLYKRDYKDE